MYSQERTFVHNGVYIQISNVMIKDDSWLMNQLWTQYCPSSELFFSVSYLKRMAYKFTKPVQDSDVIIIDSNKNNNNLNLYSALIQFVSKALYNEIHNMHRKHKSNKNTLLPISKLLISGVIYHGKLG